MNRDAAEQLMHEWTESPALRAHMRMVESCLRWHARDLGQDVELWGLAGLLHDFDYERHPEGHPGPGLDHLRTLGASDEVIRAIAAHAPERTGVEPESLLDRHLYACDEVCGFLAACTWVRPSRSILDVQVSSVKKKLKTASFAAGVDRACVLHGAELVGLSLDDHLARCLTAL
ncbi:MAG: HDIG domain-containing protein, partial [Fimbriimonadaceae bacterium]|nr:HDIG domain-containing protein [Fimbriimonadaceae bacterium]